MTQPEGEPYISDEDRARIAAHEELLKQNKGPCQYVDPVTGARCEVASISHDDIEADHDWEPAGATRLLGMHEDLPAIQVRDDVRYLDADGIDVTDEVIANNMDAMRVRDLTEE